MVFYGVLPRTRFRAASYTQEIVARRESKLSKPPTTANIASMANGNYAVLVDIVYPPMEVKMVLEPFQSILLIVQHNRDVTEGSLFSRRYLRYRLNLYLQL